MGTIQALTSSVKSYGRVLASACYASLPRFLGGLKGKVCILTYHRVLPQCDLTRQHIQPGMYVSVDVFDRQMHFLKQYFNILTFADLLAMWSAKKCDPQKRYCVITFDDGWLDNYRYAFPLLKQHRIPATIFLPTDFIGTDRWFWPDQVSWLWSRWIERSKPEQLRIWNKVCARHPWCSGFEPVLMDFSVDGFIDRCKTYSSEQITQLVQDWTDVLHVPLPSERQVINWEEVNEMSRSGISFGSHSLTHKILTTVSQQELQEEVRGSRDELRRRVDYALPIFCYPNGNWNEEIGRAVAAAGYEAAVTTEFGYESCSPSDLFGLKRINVHQDVTATDALFGFYLSRGKG